jgi:hypothetical protein
MGIKEAAVNDARSSKILSKPYAICPIPYY